MNQDMCLDLPGGDTKNGNKLWLWQCNGQNSQKWRFDPGSYQIRYAGNTGKCVDIPGSEFKDGNQLWLWDCTGQKGQYWGYDSAMQTIYASNSDSDASQCLDLYGGNAKNGAVVDIWSCLKADKNQQWTISPAGAPSGGWCQPDMNRLVATAKGDSYGKRPDGKCYTHVSSYINSDGYGGICKGCFDSKIPSSYWAEAHMFADYLNAGHAAELGMQNVQSQFANNPYKAPAGSIVVVRAGTPGTAHPTAGDIAVADGGYFWNGGAMGYGGEGNFPPSNNYVLGIFVPTRCSQGVSEVVV